MVKLKNSLKDENMTMKNEREEAETRHKKLRDKFKQTKHELEECLKFQSEQQTELEAARDRIDVRMLCIRIYKNVFPEHRAVALLI
jgi:predicted nuclease with TOPRIM domain